VDLAGHPFFDGADLELLAPLLARVRLARFAAGQFLARPGGEGSAILILSGRVRSFRLTPDGRRITFGEVAAGGAEGLQASLGLPGHFVEACEATCAGIIHQSELRKMIEDAPVLGLNLAHMAVARLAAREEQLQTVTLRDPSQRVAARLLALAADQERPGGRLVIERHPTHQDLADQIGVRRETVTLHLARLSRLGAVVVDGRRWQLRPTSLARIVGGVPESALPQFDGKPELGTLRWPLTSTPGKANGADSTSPVDSADDGHDTSRCRAMSEQDQTPCDAPTLAKPRLPS